MTSDLKRNALAAGIALAFMTGVIARPTAEAAGAAGAAAITPAALKSWLTTISSDEFEGRATFSEGLGLAAAYLAGELKTMGVKPGGDNGSYYQRVRVLGVKATSRHTATVTVNGQSRTFKAGEGIVFPRNSGGKQTVKGEQIEFVGYGAVLPMIKHDDYAGKNVAGKVVVYLGPRGPKIEDAEVARNARRLLGGRARYATDVMKAVASIGPFVQNPFGPAAAASPTATPTPTPAPAPSASPGASPAAGPGGGGGGFGQQPLPTPDFTTVQKLDNPIPPAVTAQDEFFEFLFSASDVKYADLKAKAAAQEPLPAFSLKGASITFNIDADYQVVRTQFTRNVVGIIPGTDPKLKDTYVSFGAHYDHVGYSDGELVDVPVTEQIPSGKRRQGGLGSQARQTAMDDRIWNGADDDGSGTVTLLSLAKAFATAPVKTKRSLVFVWHTGEESGLWGSRYNADYSTVPMDKVVAQLNMDMVGRNDKDKPTEKDTVYLVGSDRISTELHNLSEDANASLASPLKLNYVMNDPGDIEQVYYRSDHYSYAAKGVPIIFYTTGLHDDYHKQTDSVEKIEFEKMARISRLMYETGRRVANLDHAPAKDNKGPRVGKDVGGKLK
jgi:hypothetical protein